MLETDDRGAQRRRTRRNRLLAAANLHTEPGRPSRSRRTAAANLSPFAIAVTRWLAPLVGLASSGDAVEEFLGLGDDRALMRLEFLAAQVGREERVGIGDTAVDAA